MEESVLALLKIQGEPSIVGTCQYNPRTGAISDLDLFGVRPRRDDPKGVPLEVWHSGRRVATTVLGPKRPAPELRRKFPDESPGGTAAVGVRNALRRLGLRA